MIYHWTFRVHIDMRQRGLHEVELGGRGDQSEFEEVAAILVDHEVFECGRSILRIERCHGNRGGERSAGGEQIVNADVHLPAVALFF